jgi:hypothetical protein
MQAFVALLALQLASFTSGAAAAAVGPAERWMAWTNNADGAGDDLVRCGVTPAEAATWDRQLQQLARRVAQADVSVPAGWYGELRGAYFGPWLGALQPCRGLPMEGGLSLWMWPEGALKRVPVKGQPGVTRLQPNGHTWNVTLYINQWRGPETLKWLDDGTLPRLTVARRTGDFAGYPVFDDRTVVVTPPGYAPAFLPAPFERVLAAWLRHETAQLEQAQAELKALQAAGIKPGKLDSGPDATRLRIARAKQRLASLGTAQRQAPAYVTQAEEVTLEPEPNAMPVWVDNPRYFDPSRPRTAIQLMVLDLSTLDMRTPLNEQPSGALKLLRQFVERIDWPALARLSQEEARP